MEAIVQYTPLFALLLCDVLYILEDRLMKRKWLYNIATTALHIFAIIYFLFTESSIEIALLFLMASLAAAVTINAPKSEKIKIQEK